ncbi:MAG: hypothetical protein HQK51_14115 [Oligoflexia bacterium]|nr:hypothetical protein [Oligoflexia bacterium]
MNFHSEQKHFFSKYKILIMVVVTTLFTLLVLHPNIKAKWGAIDDHESMLFLATKAELTSTQIISEWGKEEIKKFGNSKRVRPFYYLLRELETHLWQFNVEGWYLTRIFFCVLVMFTIWYIFSNYVGLFTALLFTLLTTNERFWADLWTRLGPSESYAAAGLAVWSLVFYKILLRLKTGTAPALWMYLIFFLSSLVVIGAKENMVFMAGFVFFLEIKLILSNLNNNKFEHKFEPKVVNKAVNKIGHILNISVLIFTAMMMLSIILAMGKYQADIYGTSVETASRLNSLIRGFFRLKIVHISFYLSTILFILSHAHFNFRYNFLNKLSSLTKEIRLLWYAEFVMVAIYAFQFAFYNRNWPPSMRYDFPIQLTIFLSLFFFYLFILKFLSQYDSSRKYKRNFILIFNLGIIIYLLARNLMGLSYVDIHKNAVRNQQRTNTLMEKIMEIKNLTSLNSENSLKPIILISHNPWNAEFLISITRFFKAYKITNPLSVSVAFNKNKNKNYGFWGSNNNDESDKSSNSLIEKIAEDIFSWSLKGGEGFIALEESFQRAKNKNILPYCVGIGKKNEGKHSSSECQDIGVLKW